MIIQGYKDTTQKVNYRPISFLQSIAKVFERIKFDQMYQYFANILSPLLSGFRKGYSTQHALVRVIESWKKCLDSSDIVGTILMDLSKAYDCIPYDLLIAKLSAYGRHVQSPSRGPNPALDQILSGLQPSHEIYNARILLFD